jgi:predicted ATPase
MKKKEEERKKRNIFMQPSFPFIFQGSEERSYFQVWSNV